MQSACVPLVLMKFLSSLERATALLQWPSGSSIKNLATSSSRIDADWPFPAADAEMWHRRQDSTFGP